MPGGRPKGTPDEVCSCQGFDSAGFCYFDTVRKEGQVYYYPRFRHLDPRIKDHPIKDWGPLQDLTEYTREGSKVTIYSLKGAHTIIGPTRVVVYDVSRLRENERIPDFVGICDVCREYCVHTHDIKCDICNNTTIVWCPKCKSHLDFSSIVSSRQFNGSARMMNLELELKKSGLPILKLTDVLWFLKANKRIDKGAREFLSRLCKLLEDPSHNFIITYGDRCRREADRLSKLFDCDMEFRTDKFGILKRLQTRVSMRNKQIEAYNKPCPTLPSLIDSSATT